MTRDCRSCEAARIEREAPTPGIPCNIPTLLRCTATDRIAKAWFGNPPKVVWSPHWCPKRQNERNGE